jgi:hypothetical protein
LAFRCSQGLAEYVSEESEEDGIMIAPRAMAGICNLFLRVRNLEDFGNPPPIPAKLLELKYLAVSSTGIKT